MTDTTDITWSVAFTSALLLGIRVPVRQDRLAIPKRIATGLILFGLGGGIGTVAGTYGPFVAAAAIFGGFKLAAILLDPTRSRAQPENEHPPKAIAQPPGPEPTDAVGAPVAADRRPLARRYLYFAALAGVVALLEYATGHRDGWYWWGRGAISFMLRAPVQYWNGTNWFTLIGTGAAAYFINRSTRQG